MVVFDLLFLIISGVECLSMCFLATCMSSWENTYLGPLAVLKSGRLFFYIELYTFLVCFGY